MRLNKCPYSALFLIFLISFGTSRAQDLTTGKKVWYSFYTNGKLGQKTTLEYYQLNGFNLNRHSFSFNQQEVLLDYRLKRSHHIYSAYSFSLYKYISAYERRYSLEPNALNTIGFHRLAIGYRHKKRLNATFLLNQDAAIQVYAPRLTKYRARVVYRAKISANRAGWPMRAKPFVQGGIFYYMGGTPIPYYSEEAIDSLGENATPEKIASPNGLHRARVRAGISFKPIKKCENLSLTFYWALNKEFNLFGNDLNSEVPEDVDTGEFNFEPNGENIYNKFNNYHIFGIHLTYLIRRKH